MFLLQDNAYLDTIEIIRKHGAIVKHPVNLPSPTELTLDDEWTPATVNSMKTCTAAVFTEMANKSSI